MSLTEVTTLKLVAADTTVQNDPSLFKVERLERMEATIEKVTASLKWNGGVVVKNFLNADEIEKFDKQASALLSVTEFQEAGDTTKRVTRLPIHMPELVTRVLTDDLMLGVCDNMLTVKHQTWLGNRYMEMEDKPIVQMTTAFAIAPGTAAQDLHRDDGLYYNSLPNIKAGEYEFGRDKAISFFIAGRKSTKANGATNFIPGSHLQSTSTPPDLGAAISAELDAGDAFFMCASAYHGGGQNSTTDQERLVYGIFMMQPILRQEENLYLAIPTEQIKKFPKSVQKRLGYDIASPFLGWIDYKSPLNVILGDTTQERAMVLKYGEEETVA